MGIWRVFGGNLLGVGTVLDRWGAVLEGSGLAREIAGGEGDPVLGVGMERGVVDGGTSGHVGYVAGGCVGVLNFLGRGNWAWGGCLFPILS